MGALGDGGAHLIDTVHEFLELGLPTEVNMLRAEGHNPFFYPYSSTIEFKFPARGDMPPVDITWYDGLDNIPAVPEGYASMNSRVGHGSVGLMESRLQTKKLISLLEKIWIGMTLKLFGKKTGEN